MENQIQCLLNLQSIKQYKWRNRDENGDWDAAMVDAVGGDDLILIGG